MTAYPTWEEGEEVLVPKNGLFKMGCCDCGLVHLIQFDHDEDGDITMKVYRLERSIGQMRRWMRKKKEGIWSER